MAATQCQSGQSAQPVEVAAAEHVQGPVSVSVSQGQPADAGQVRRGQLCTVGRPGYRCHNDVAHPRAATTDGRRRHRDGEHEMVGVTVTVGDRPGIGARRGDTRRGAGERARGQVDDQPGGQRSDEGIAQQAGAASGGRQDHYPLPLTPALSQREREIF